MYTCVCVCVCVCVVCVCMCVYVCVCSLVSQTAFSFILGQEEKGITADCQPVIAYLKLGRTLHRILLVSIPYPFSSCSDIKEEKVIWLTRLICVCI